VLASPGFKCPDEVRAEKAFPSGDGEAFGPKVGGWRFEVGGWRMEVGGWRFKVGGWRLEVGV